MTQNEINELAVANQRKAYEVIDESGIARIWRDAGCRVNLIGSLKMGLLMKHLDIDMHVYSSGITAENTFAIAARMSELPGVVEITGINGLYTDEHCMAWHVKYRSTSGEMWKFDIIHIEAGTEYDGYFEHMADRILAVITPLQRDTILRLKYSTPDTEVIHGVEYYEAVIAYGIENIEDLRRWVGSHRTLSPCYWIP